MIDVFACRPKTDLAFLLFFPDGVGWGMGQYLRLGGMPWGGVGLGFQRHVAGISTCMYLLIYDYIYII